MIVTTAHFLDISHTVSSSIRSASSPGFPKLTALLSKTRTTILIPETSFNTPIDLSWTWTLTESRLFLSPSLSLTLPVSTSCLPLPDHPKINTFCHSPCREPSPPLAPVSVFHSFSPFLSAPASSATSSTASFVVLVGRLVHRFLHRTRRFLERRPGIHPTNISSAAEQSPTAYNVPLA